MIVDVKYVIFLPSNSSVTKVYAQSTFYPQSAVLILHFAPTLHFPSVCSLHFTPGLQSAFYTDQILVTTL